MYSIDDQVKFIEIRDFPVLPTMMLLHQYPTMMPHMQCDKGAIKHILSGSDIMCQGLTSPGGKMDEVESEQVVAVMAEGKEHAMAIGYTLMSKKNIIKVNQDKCIQLLMYLGDGMWKLAFKQNVAS
mmetsp:Transcript_5750/g.5221  ORF Transcript_5750/g.5221 Transcript_5750/m.5221 type:complete len:126 (+) Transcript_5750:179-556(+)